MITRSLPKCCVLYFRGLNRQMVRRSPLGKVTDPLMSVSPVRSCTASPGRAAVQSWNWIMARTVGVAIANTASRSF
jgi:hypothetical protein